MIPVDGLSLEDEQDDDAEDGQGDNFLNDFELQEVERAAVVLEADAVGRDCEAVFKKGDTPREKDDADQRPSGRDFHLGEFQVSIPGERHEDIRENKHDDRPNPVHSRFFL